MEGKEFETMAVQEVHIMAIRRVSAHAHLNELRFRVEVDSEEGVSDLLLSDNEARQLVAEIESARRRPNR